MSLYLTLNNNVLSSSDHTAQIGRVSDVECQRENGAVVCVCVNEMEREERDRA